MRPTEPAARRLPTGAPHWLQDIDATLPVTGQYVLHGNLRDVHLLPEDGINTARFVDTVSSLWWVLRRSGYEYLLRHDPVTGLHVVRDPDPAVTEAASAAAEAVLHGGTAQLGRTASPEALAEVVRAVARSAEHRGGVVLDYVSQLRVDNQPFPDDLRRLMLAALLEVHAGFASRSPGAVRPGPLHNARFWFVDRSPDLPSWLVGGSDGIRQVPLPLPDLDTRFRAAELLVQRLWTTPAPGVGAPAPSTACTAPRSFTPDAMRELAARFARVSEGLTLRAMHQSIRLAVENGNSPAEIDDAVRAYRVGLTENMWKRPVLRENIRRAPQVLSAGILGQERAVEHVVDILVRSTLGMTSAQLGSSAAGPRGVLFFAGPTGVGKTELAKQMTSLLFGDERAYIRFDMSEFAAEHSEARLLGSPPGYVGHGSGGELTNAVRQRPFSVVLFDEIEKAHPRILDKFLQILSDGRLTDGMGATVHFTETIIVFTSNLGVAEADARMRANPDSDYHETMAEVIRHEFTDRDRFNRPELLGRIGDNLVIFDRIRAEVAERLATRFIENVLDRVETEVGVNVTMPDEVRTAIITAVTADLSTGGRGIGMRVESLLVNPLARALMAHGATTAKLTGFAVVDGGGRVQLV